jgi:hypothetical protein
MELRKQNDKIKIKKYGEMKKKERLNCKKKNYATYMNNEVL